MGYAWRAAVSSQILITTSDAFSKEGMGRNSCGPWKLRPPAKMLGQGSPLNESCAPSVPPVSYTHLTLPTKA